MGHADFVHLRVHSAYSLSEGALKLKELVKLCQKNAMPAVAVTDTGNLFGVLEFSLAARDAGLQPIIGCQFAVRRQNGSGRSGAGRSVAAHHQTPDQIVLLVQSEAGYRNLMRLISRAYLGNEPGDDPQLPLDAFDGQTDGLICLTGGPDGPVGRPLADGHRTEAEAALDRLQALFADRLYMEIQRHDTELEDRIEADLVGLADERGIPLVATNDCYFSGPDMFEAHDALLCVAQGTTMSDDSRRRVTAHHCFKSAAEMRALFEDLPDAVDNTVVIARRCAFMLGKIDPILPPYDTAGGRSQAEELRAQAVDGLEERLVRHVFMADMDADAREEAAKPYRERLDRELGIIESMGFPGYFLIVSDFIKWAKNHSIPVGPGRGSGAGSVVAWALTITDLDPIRFNLLFERFLNPERVSMPDFDVDFCQDRRDDVINYTQDKYGYDKVAQIITFGKLQARAVLRDVGRVMGMPYGQVDKICKLVPNNPANPVTLQQALDGEPLMQEMKANDEQVSRLIDTALKLEGLYRHASTHAAGVVIGDRPLDQLVPLYRDPRSDMPVTQFNMKYVEQAGLVKFDFLGLKTLTVLQRAVELIAERDDVDAPPDLGALPLSDESTYAMLTRAETTGVFQLESSGMRDVLKRVRPNRFEDIIALVALYRPGPMDNIPKYIKVKNGEEEPDYLHPILEPILKETFGIMIYQEQVMQAAQELAGYSLGSADLLRRAMGKKIQAEMDAQRKAFTDGAVERGVDRDQAGLIFDQVAKFAGYGFNKSHAAAYALVAYQTAYLKANFPVEFLAASMTLDINNTDKLNVFRQELDRLKIKLLPPDVNSSNATFRVERLANGERAIRYALGAIKGVGQQAMEHLVAARRGGGQFTSLFDFARRVDPKVLSKRQMETLTCAGAFESLDSNRARLFQGLETILRYGQAAAEDRNSGQESLFGGPDSGLDTPELPPIEDWEPMARLRHEFDAIGFYLSAHPLDGYKRALDRLGVITYGELPQRMSSAGSTRFRLAGVVTGRTERTSKSGNRYAFIQLSDTSGVYEVMVFSEVLAKSRELLEGGNAVMVTVDAQTQDDTIRLSGNEVASLDAAVERAAAGLRIFVERPDAIDQLKSTLDGEAPGRGRIELVLNLDDRREVEMTLKRTWTISPGARRAIKAISGVREVQEL